MQGAVEASSSFHFEASSCIAWRVRATTKITKFSITRGPSDSTTWLTQTLPVLNRKALSSSIEATTLSVLKWCLRIMWILQWSRNCREAGWTGQRPWFSYLKTVKILRLLNLSKSRRKKIKRLIVKLASPKWRLTWKIGKRIDWKHSSW